MCGIIARIGHGNAAETLLSGLENLEYRGYDSAGIAVQNGSGVKIHKCSGEVSDLKSSLESRPHGNMGIGHTRWSTHGPPTDENAHPHTDTAGDVAVVHNGVIDNYDELRSELQAKGHEFESETDTEVIPHLIDDYREETGDSETAVRRAVETLEGSYAIAAIVDGEEAVYAARKGSPLVLGLDEEEWFLASDVPAFLDYTDEVIYLEDGDLVVLEPDSYQITDLGGETVERSTDTVDWDPEDAGKGEYDHYMLKEINSQPTTLANTIEGRVQDGDVVFEDLPEGTFADVETVQFVACGTSYHAAMYADQLLRSAGIRTDVVRASEYDSMSGPVDENTLVVAVTQSGETADTLDAVRTASANGARSLAVTNVVGSTAARETDDAVYIRAGPEVGVAATKTFSSQAVTLALLSQQLAADVPDVSPPEDSDAMLESLDALPGHLETVLENSNAESLASDLIDSQSFFFIGNGLGHPVALEGALKFKEITYEHAEGFASGELKHGPLALVTPETPVFAVATGSDSKTKTNAIEAQTRGAPIVAVSPDDNPLVDVAEDHLTIPDTHPVWAGLLANVQLQLLSYYAADELGRSIDKPRNLAKSVTVE
ncbi:glutamine--fructose-6-phosphate transaminase (isomerizing) [Natronorubrum daqingense]|uniref:Glutamine--fructose-6-phosphate aminotransferase [isomerizing] n=1 Tax=Natronorubrum daqingense TaxID=588898 RepID=A0A1N6YIU8_9EURY|nr:glutamine--fructose-6-phosphate transaminase (isomerizing) [Natronorubrum daqingense]APX95652.1 glutamine--fructose-6-phosphate transaminase (isomerizing) [Natronorubrum daqingense]SIR14512.1 glucosamine--fructose-6-phosphate aminotransferase (isomerizing) [Natronorubrum daqingense]